MGLRDQVAADIQAILENEDDFGGPITVINPSGVELEAVGHSNDIATVIDPETGIAVTGRRASIALSLLTLDAEAGFGIPRGVADSASDPWRVKFQDILGKAHTFKVIEANPDRAAGCVTCTLEAYKD